MNVKILIVVVSAVVLAGALRSAAETPGETGLAIATSKVGKAYLTYNGKPLFAFGLGDEMRIISGAADVERWAKWQHENGMTLIRAYPASVPLEVYGTPGLDPFQKQGEKWDVDAFNDEYFAHLGEVAAALERYDIILHLQLWQICFFKGGDARWNANYLNPANNINEWTRSLSRGEDYIDAPAGTPARAHQRKWVTRVLDAMKGRGNVFIDVINELGNTMGTLEWATEVTEWIRTWEKEKDWSFIVGVDSEHHYKPELFGRYKEHFDIVILNELQSRDHALSAIAAFHMPAVTVRSSDGRNRSQDYMFTGTEQSGPEHQTRYRTLCYRSLFAGVQSVGAYWKSEVQDADYLDMAHWPAYARALRAFWKEIRPYWPVLEPDAQNKHIVSAVTPHAYALTSPSLMAVYLECGSHTWNNAYPASSLVLRCPFDAPSVAYFNPQTGDSAPAEYKRDGNLLRIELPSFTDDAVVVVKDAGANAGK